ncbi:hemagglutinin repeat-containing protein, partial [Escherichia coli]
GRPVMNADGSLQALEVTEGSITINGAGLDGTRSDAVSIIARATEVNAALHAKDLTVTAGANRITADGRVSALKGEGDVPKVAVDTGALGGMYARRIHLTSTESGVGVNLGNLYAREGDIILNSAGKLVLKNSLAGGNTTVTGTDASLSGDNKAGGNLSVTGTTGLTLNQSRLVTDKNLVLSSSGQIVQNGGELTAGQNAMLSAQHLNQTSGTVNAAENVTLTTTDDTTLKGRSIAGKTLTVSSGSLNNGGTLVAGRDATVKTGTFSNTGTVQGNGLKVTAADLTSTGSIKSGSTLDISARNATLSGDAGAKDSARVTVSGTLENRGRLVSDDVLTLSATQINNSGTLSGAKELVASADTLTTTEKSVTNSDGNLMLNSASSTLAGETSAGGTVSVKGNNLKTTTTAQTQGNSVSVDVQNAQLDGTQAARDILTLNASEKLTHSGKSSAPSLSLSAPELTSSGVLVGSALNTQSQTLTNSGLLQGKASLTVNTQRLDNQQNGTLYSAADLTLDIPDISNISSVISGKTVQLESVSGNISNITRRQQWNAGSDSRYGGVHLSGTDTGPVATIKGTDSLSLDAGKNIDITGATVSSGGTLGMSAGNDINIAANLISGSKSQSGFWHTDDNSASSTTSQGSNISAGDNLTMAAGHNLDVTASSVSAGHSALLSAGNDLSLNAVRESKNSRNGRSENHESHAAVSTVTAGDNLLLVAGRDVASQAAGMAAENNVAIRAGRDVNLVAESASAGDSYTSKKKKEINETVRQQGTEIASGGDTTVNAGRDITAVASSVTATGNISVNAGRDVALTTATESDYHYLETKKKSGGFLSKKTTHTISEDSASREAGSLLSGNRVTVNAGDNLTVEGSDVVADQDVSLAAGNHVDVLAATSTDTSWRFKETKKSGLMGTGGIGFTIGSSKTTHDRREAETTQSQSASTIGSTAGNVSITAGKQAHISGSDVIANRDISITGDSVVVDPGHDRRTVDEKFEQKKSGLTVALSGTVGSAINNAVTSAQETKKSSDSRLKTLQATKTALSGVQAGQAAAMASATGDPNAMGVSLSLTTQKSKSQQHSESDTVSGSTLNAGNNLSVVATGKNRGDNRGDIVIAGSQLKAGGNTSLDAANDVLLSGAANTQKTTGRNSSSGGGVGVSIGAGKGAGISAFASVNAAKGSEKGNGTEWTETTIDSGKTVTINSGRDTVLNGAQVNGNRIIADVGHDLLISSQQDTSKYDSKQTSVAAGGSFTFGSMTGSGYIAASRDKMKSRFDSVAEQTGMFAGDGGFDITVGRHTQLDGAVIASTATPDKNHLDTGTLGFSDLHNEADYKVSHSGISLSGGGSFGDKFQGNMPGGMISAGGHSGHAEGTTQAAVAEGTITIRDRDNQKQNLANLSRDPVHANDSISPIFDKEKEQRRLQTVGLISDIGSQVADIARTQGELNALKAAQVKYGPVPADATEEQRQAYQAKLRDTPEYKKEQEKYGTGSEIQRGIQAATAALQGLAGGNLAGALAGASAPELAHLLKSTEKDPAVNAIAHAILGGAVAAMQGNNVAAGAAGAATGELAARAIAGMLYPGVKQSDLSEEQKQTISTLATVSAGLAGGLTGNSTASAAVGAQSGKNAVENNFLTADQIDSFAAKAKGCEVRGDCKQIIKEMEELSLKQQQEMIAVCATNPAACKEKFGDIPAKGMLVREAIDRVLGTDVPSAMKNDMSSLLAQQIEAEGVVTSTEFASQLQNRYGIDKQQAEILAVAALGAVTGGMGKSGTSTVTKNIVVVNSGKKGAWNQAMNKPEPNTIYKVDGNKTFQTDALGRTSSVEGILVASKSDRNTYQQCKAGKCGSSGDEGGHLIASIFNGPGEKLNLVPMDGNLNKGVWKQMENTWANALKDGKQVNVKIEPVYTGENKRPDSFSVTYSIDGGRPVIKDISNAPRGVK